MTFPSQRSLRAALAACALLLAACTPSAPSTGPAPAALPPMAWTAQSPAAEIAAWARQGCRRAAGGKDACVERALVGLIDPTGIAKSMEVLDTLVNVDADVRLNAHALAHGLGISAYRSPETLARTFAACPPTQMSGCYHGVIQGYFLALDRQGRPVGTAELDGLCEPHRATVFLYFQCAHGMGHGLMAVHENHVPMALEACDQATETFIQQSCYGGVFMENIVNVTHPHHTAGGHAGTQGDGHAAHAQQASAPAPAYAHAGHAQAAPGEHAGHDAHGGHAAAAPMQHGEWKALDRSDPLYPCNAIAEKYQESCYTMQTSAILPFNGSDVAATARVCERAPAPMVSVCFASLGRDITALAAQDHGRSIEMCGRTRGTADGRGELWCNLGVVQNLVNLAADPQEGIRYCRAVRDAEIKEPCYRMVGESIATLLAGAEARGQQCQSAEAAFVAACRSGAGIEPSGSEDE
jgi:hypothetical protein